jgi:predicted transcriptional regulator
MDSQKGNCFNLESDPGGKEMELIKIVGEIVQVQASHGQMTGDDVADAIKKVYKALKWVQAQEEKAAQIASQPAMSWKDSIQRNKVVCLECGKEFKQISARHLGAHDMDRKSYKEKYGIPSKQSLSARTLSAKRRRVAKERGLGEKMQKAKRGKKKA